MPKTPDTPSRTPASTNLDAPTPAEDCQLQQLIARIAYGCRAIESLGKMHWIHRVGHYKSDLASHTCSSLLCRLKKEQYFPVEPCLPPLQQLRS